MNKFLKILFIVSTILAVSGFVAAGGGQTVPQTEWEYTGHTKSVEGVAVDGDGNVYSGSQDDEVHKINPQGDQEWTYTEHTESVYDVAVDGVGNVYSASRDGEVHKIDSNGDQVWTYTGHTDRVQGVAVDGDGNVYSASEDNEVHKIDSDGNKVWEYTGHSDSVNSVAVDEDGNVYSGSLDDEVHKIDSDGNNVWEYTGHSSFVSVYDVAVDSDGNVYSVSSDEDVHKIDSDGNNVWEYTGHSDTVQGVAVDKDGNVYSASWDDQLHNIDSDGNNIWEYTGHSDSVYSVAVDEDGNVYSGSLDDEVHKLNQVELQDSNVSLLSPNDGETLTFEWDEEFTVDHDFEIESNDYEIVEYTVTAEHQDDTYTVTENISQGEQTTETYTETITVDHEGDYDYSVEVEADDGTTFSSGTNTYTVTQDEFQEPQVDTDPATNVELYSGTLNAELTDLKDAENSDVYFEYRETGESTWIETDKETVASPQEFSEDVDGLDSNTEYEFRAAADYSEDGGGTVYGDTLTFTTEEFTEPDVETLPASDVNVESATLEGELVELNDAEDVDGYFEYREDGETNWTTTPVETLTTLQEYSELVENLDPDTTYEFRAVGDYDEEGGGSVYGDVLTFETLAEGDVEIVRPEDGDSISYLNKDDVAFEVNAVSRDEDATVTFYRDGTSFYSETITQDDEYVTVETTDSVDVGTHDWYAELEGEDSGDIVTTDNATFTVEDAEITTNLIAPADNQIFDYSETRNHEFEVNTEEDVIARLYVEDTEIYTESLDAQASTYTLTYDDDTELPSGDYDWYVEVDDQETGQTETSEVRTFTVESPDPVTEGNWTSTVRGISDATDFNTTVEIPDPDNSSVELEIRLYDEMEDEEPSDTINVMLENGHNEVSLDSYSQEYAETVYHWERKTEDIETPTLQSYEYSGATVDEDTAPFGVTFVPVFILFLTLMGVASLMRV